MTGRPSLIAVDWGTSALRAALVTADGCVLDRLSSNDGILAAAPKGFAQVLAGHLAKWRAAHPGLPVLMSGMIGSRQGWAEAPYLTCPAEPAALATGLLRLPDDGSLAIVPGLTTRDAHAIPDVMRGEETQILGALDLLGIEHGTLVLPGTHSKWATVSSGLITGFTTYMTGEIYAALRSATILGRLMTTDDATSGSAAQIGPGFVRGVAAAARLDGPPGMLLHAVFSTRTLTLLGELPPEQGAEYLSGLLIGAEMRAGAGLISGPVVVIGAEALAARYIAAATALDMPVTAAPADCAVAGLLAIAKAAGLLET